MSDMQEILDLEAMMENNCDEVRGAPRWLADDASDADRSATEFDCDDDAFFAAFFDDDTEDEAEVQAKAPP
eukprot:1002838-Heterocapsa_arctica.AAC.1